MFRTGARTPMQWDTGKNAGFSTAEKDDLYLPLDPDEKRPNVAQEEQDPNSILNFVKEIIALRKENPALGNTADFRILFAQENTYPLVYEREGSGQKLIVAVNPAARACEATLPHPVGDILYSRVEKWTPPAARCKWREKASSSIRYNKARPTRSLPEAGPRVGQPIGIRFFFKRGEVVHASKKNFLYPCGGLYSSNRLSRSSVRHRPLRMWERSCHRRSRLHIVIALPPLRHTAGRANLEPDGGEYTPRPTQICATTRKRDWKGLFRQLEHVGERIE